MGNVLITGLTGRSGRHFGELLVRNAYPGAIALVRDAKKFESLYGGQEILTCVEGDTQDEAGLEKILADHNISTIFHISGIKQTPSILNVVLRSGGVDRLVLVHTTGIYSKFKAASEEYLQIETQMLERLHGTGIRVTILRPTMIYGSLDDRNISVFLRMVDKLRIFPLVKSGHYELQPVNQEDLGRAYYQVLTAPDATMDRNYNLSGNDVIYLRDMLAMMSKLLGKKTVFVPVPYWIAYSGAWVLYLLTLTKVDFRERVQRLVEPRAYSNTDARRDFGYDPMPFAEGLKREVWLYQERKK